MTSKLKKISFTFLLMTILMMTQVDADNLKTEINHLIDFINLSDCAFIRNGIEYSPREASAHIMNKYSYFKKKISTAEDFIHLCATKSTMSNRFYEIKCKRQPKVKSKDWLMAELKRYRKEKIQK